MELMRLDREACLESLFSLLRLMLCSPARFTVVGMHTSDMRCTSFREKLPERSSSVQSGGSTVETVSLKVVLSCGVLGRPCKHIDR